MSTRNKAGAERPLPNKTEATPRGVAEDYHAKIGASRVTHSAAVRCTHLLSILKGRWLSLDGDYDESTFDTMLGRLFDGTFGTADEAAAVWLANPPEHPDFAAMCMAVAYCADAIKAEQAGDHGKAWDFAFDAAHFEGVLSGLDAAGDPERAKQAIQQTLRDRALRASVLAAGNQSAKARGDQQSAATKELVRKVYESLGPATKKSTGVVGIIAAKIGKSDRQTRKYVKQIQAEQKYGNKP